MIRDEIRIMWLCSESAMNGSANNNVTKIARIFGTKISVCFLNLGQRLEQRHHDANHKPDHHQRRGHHHDRPDRIARHVESFCTGHFTLSLLEPHGQRITSSEWLPLAAIRY